MTDRLLTFELSSDGDELEIHGNPEGLRSLIERLGFYPGRRPLPGAVWLHAVSLGETRAALPLGS